LEKFNQKDVFKGRIKTIEERILGRIWNVLQPDSVIEAPKKQVYAVQYQDERCGNEI
jgi:hypothetical protein